MQQEQQRRQPWRCRSVEPSPSPLGRGGRTTSLSRKAHGRALEAVAATAREYKNVPDGTPIFYDGRHGRHGAFVAVADRKALGFSLRRVLLEEAAAAAAAVAAARPRQPRQQQQQQLLHAPEQSPQRNHRLTMTPYDGRHGAAYRPGSAASSPRVPRPPSQSKYRLACCGGGGGGTAACAASSSASPTAAADGEVAGVLAASASASAVPRTPPPPPPPPSHEAAATATAAAEAAVVASRLLLSPQTRRENRVVAGTLRLPEAAGGCSPDGDDDDDDDGAGDAVDAAACAAVLQRYRRRLREERETREAAARRRREAHVTASRRRMKGRDGYLIASSNATPDGGGGGGGCCDDNVAAAAAAAAASDQENDATCEAALQPDRDEGDVRSLRGSVAASQPPAEEGEKEAAAAASSSSAIEIPLSPIPLPPPPPASLPPRPPSPSARRAPTQRPRPPRAAAAAAASGGGDRRRFARYRRRGVAVRRRLERLEAAGVQRAVSGLRENRQAEVLRRRRAALWCGCCVGASFFSAAVYVRSLLLERARRLREEEEAAGGGGDSLNADDEDDRWMRIIGPEGMDIVPGSAKADVSLPPPRAPLLPSALVRRTQDFIARNYGTVEERRAATLAVQPPVPHAITLAEQTVLRHFLQAYGLKAWRCEAPGQQSQMLSLAASVWQRGDGSPRSQASPGSWGGSNDGSPRLEASTRSPNAVTGDGGHAYVTVRSKNVKLFSTAAYAVARFKELPRMKAVATARVKDALGNVARLLRFKRALRAYVDRVRVVQRALLHRQRRRAISLLFHHLAFSAAEARCTAHGRRAAPPAAAAAAGGAALLRAPGSGSGSGSGSGEPGGEGEAAEAAAAAATAHAAASVAQRAPFWLRSCLLARTMQERRRASWKAVRAYEEDFETWEKGLNVARYLAGCDEAIAAAFLQKHGPPPQPPHQAFLLPRRAADALVQEARRLMASAGGVSGSAAARLREVHGGEAQAASFAELLATTQFASPGQLLFSRGFAWEREREGDEGGGGGDSPHSPRPPASVLSGADAAAVPAASARCELRFDA